MAMKQTLKVDWKKLLWQSHADPWADVTRLLLIGGFLIAVWWHSWFAMLLITLAIIINPISFPAPKNPRHFIHRMNLGKRLWLEFTPPLLKNLARIGEISMTLGLLVAAWQNQLFQAILLAAGLTGYKFYFMFYLTLLHDTKEAENKDIPPK
jgi:hypothetical protein